MFLRVWEDLDSVLELRTEEDEASLENKIWEEEERVSLLETRFWEQRELWS